MIIFSWPTIEKLFVKIFSGASVISYWSNACSGRSGLSIAPTLDRVGRVQVKNDTIEKKWRTVSQFLPLKKNAHILKNDAVFNIHTTGENNTHLLGRPVYYTLRSRTKLS